MINIKVSKLFLGFSFWRLNCFFLIIWFDIYIGGGCVGVIYCVENM